MLPELELRQRIAWIQYVGTVHQEQVRIFETTDFPSVQGLSRWQGPGSRHLVPLLSDKLAVVCVEWTVRETPLVDPLPGDVQRIEERENVAVGELFVPIPDGHQLMSAVRGRWLFRLSWMVSKGEALVFGGTVEDEIPEHSEGDAVPESRQINFRELERRRVLLKDLPNAIEKEKKNWRLLGKKKQEYYTNVEGNWGLIKVWMAASQQHKVDKQSLVAAIYSWDRYSIWRRNFLRSHALADATRVILSWKQTTVSIC